MTLQFSEEDLLRELGAATVDKGELLWIDDRVRQVQVVAGGTLISGALKGSNDSGALAVTGSALSVPWSSKCWSSTATTCLQLTPTGQLQ